MKNRKQLHSLNFLSRFLFLIMTPVFFQYFALGFIWHSICWGVITLTMLIWGIFIIITPLFGRVGCGWFCFMGTTYDCVGMIHSKKTKYRKPLVWLRLLVSLSFILSAFTFYIINSKQGMTNGFEVKPFFLKANFDDHYKVVWMIDIFSAIILALITTKRWGCKNMCVIGFLCSLTARHSRLLPVVDTHKCTNCGRCETECLTGIPISEYIKNNRGLVANSECIMCGKCTNTCRVDAIKLKFIWNRKHYINNQQNKNANES